jgi:hypothetical protein
MQVVQSPSGRPVTREDGTGLGLADGPSFMSSFADAFTKVAPSIANIYTTQAQVKIAQSNARMQQAYGMTGQIPGQGYPQYAPSSPLSGLMMPLLLAGGAVVAVMLLKK